MDPVGLLLSTDVPAYWDVAEAPFPAPPSAPKAATSCCPFCGNQARAHDAKEEQRRHLNSLLSTAYIYAVVPLVPVPEKITGVQKIEVPWARLGSEFTQLFEALVMALIRRIPVKTAAAILETSDARLWRFVDREADQKEPCGAPSGYPVVERRSGGRGRDCLDLSYDLDVSFEVSVQESVTDSVSAGQVAVGKEKGPALKSEVYKVYLLAALAARVRAELTNEHFQVIGSQKGSLGKVSAQEGMLEPGKSRAPPQAV